MFDKILSKMLRKLEGAKYRCARVFKPKKRSLKYLRYRNADFVVLANEDVGWALLAHRAFEKEEMRILEKYIKPGDTCLDIGANIGLYSVFMGRMAGSDGRVYAFEPVRINQKILALNLELNDIDNVILKDCVVGNQDGEIEFSVSKDAAYSSIQATGRYEESTRIQKYSLTLDSFVNQESLRVDIMKIDVEGAELLVLKGGRNLLSNPVLQPRAVLVELNATNEAVYDYSPQDIIYYMEKCGFSVFSITKKGLEQGWPRLGCTRDVMFLSDSK